MDTGANPVQELHFIKMILWLWDQYEDDEKAHAALCELVRFLYIHRFPDGMYEDLYDLYEYVGGDMRNFKRGSHEVRPNDLKGRAMYERDIQAYFGETGREMTVLDQWLFTDVGYYILRLGMIQVKILKALDGVLWLFEARATRQIPALTDLCNRVRDRINILDDDKNWNKVHNTIEPYYMDGLDIFSLGWFYKKQILSHYPEVDSEDVEWDMVRREKVGDDAYAHYFVSRNRSYVLVTAADNSKIDFTPSPMYQLVKYKGRESIGLQFDVELYAPGLMGTYRLYLEKPASQMGTTATPKNEES
jgi:hypothetical protein